MRQAFRIAALSMGFAFALSACRDGEVSSDRQRREVTPLDQAALDAGIIADSTSDDLVGIYERRHENGRNQVCIGDDDRFGMIADLGQGLLCQGRGTVSTSGDRLRFVFDGSHGCVARAGYDGRDIRLDGKVEGDCSNLCSSRATFAGLVVGKVDEGAAQEVVSRIDRGTVKRGQPLCGST